MQTIFHYLNRTFFIIANGVLLLLIGYFFILGVGRVDGQSMEPTLKDSELFLVNHFVYLIHKPRRFDLVQFYQPSTNDRLLVKRIIGLPGETVSIKRGHVYIGTQNHNEEELLKEPYISEAVKTYMKNNNATSFLVPDNAYFVLGDNRLFSSDSREYGVVSRKYITGKIYPIFK